MLYRYLCYEEKDYRFCTKSINFSNENYYKKDKIKEKKSVKLLMLYDDSESKIVTEERKFDCFKEFMRVVS